jgi:hypothetical protein
MKPSDNLPSNDELTEKPAAESDQQYGDFTVGKFDKEKFLIVSIFGLVTSIIGIVIISDYKITPENHSEFTVSDSIEFISEVFPKSPKDILLFLLGNILLFVGVFSIFQGLKIIVKYISGKARMR